MSKNHTGKILAIGIIVLFIGVGIHPAFAVEDRTSASENENLIIASEEIYEKPVGLSLLKRYATQIYQYGWEEQATGFSEPRGLHDIYAVDEHIVWAVAYDASGVNEPICEFTKTENGGELWEANEIIGAPDEGDTAMIFAVDENHAWVPIHSGDPQGIWATSDGGETWVHQDTAEFSEGGAFPNIVHFWDENIGWCQGDPVDGYFEMYTTTDGGNNWERVPQENIPTPLPGEYGIVGYYDVVGDTVWWGTANAYPLRVFRSKDRGYSWEAFEVPFDAGSYVDIQFKDENNGIAIDKNFEFAFLAETSDGGETWHLIDYEGTCFAADFDYVPNTANMYISSGVNAIVPAARGFSRSFDGGHSWSIWTDVPEEVLLGYTGASTWVNPGRVMGWVGGINEDEFTGGVWKYTGPSNIPPTPPIIIGEKDPTPEIKYEYSFTSIDPNGDNISYLIDWGDGTVEGWYGPYKSGDSIYAAHTYHDKSAQYIRAKAKDHPYEAESDWSYLWIRGRDRNHESNNKEDCNCKEIDSRHLVILERQLNRLEVYTKLLLVLSKYNPELKEISEKLSNEISTLNEMFEELTNDRFPIICDNLEKIVYFIDGYAGYLVFLLDIYQDYPIIYNIILLMVAPLVTIEMSFTILAFIFQCSWIKPFP